MSNNTTPAHSTIEVHIDEQLSEETQLAILKEVLVKLDAVPEVPSE